MSRKIALFSFVFVVVFFVAALLLVVGPTQDAQTGSSSVSNATDTVSDAADTVSDAVDSVNEALEDSPVGEAFEALDEATSN